MKIDCSICKTHCCGGSPVKSPILMFDETERFKNDSYKDGDFFRIKRNEQGLCKFLNEQNRCSIYADRPLECRLYPYILNYKNEEISLILHNGCPQKEKSQLPEIPERIKQFPKKWWERWSFI
jgi:Fe-S-cluster containining protein